jgi:hypothetical protein
MTNALSTYLSLGLGAIIGAVISWWRFFFYLRRGKGK